MRGGRVLHKLAKIIRRLNGVSGFESYLEVLQGFDAPGAPTREQARSDYFRMPAHRGR